MLASRRRTLGTALSRARGCGVFALLVVVLAVAGAFHLHRDAEPYFARRHGELRSAALEQRRALGADAIEYRRLVSSSGLECPLAVRTPPLADADGERREKLPLVVLVGGHRTGRDAVALMPEGEGLIAAALSYPFDGEVAPKGWRAVAALPRIRRALLDAVPCLSLVVDHLEQHPRVDSARIELVGVSLGAPIAVAAGGVDERFARVWSVHGGGAFTTMLAHNLPEEVQSPPLRAPLAAFGALIVAPLEPERFAASISPRPFVMINSRDDERIPRASVDSLFAAAEQPKELLWVDGRHVGPRRAETLERLLALVLPRVGERRAGEPGAPSP